MADTNKIAPAADNEVPPAKAGRPELEGEELGDGVGI